MSLNQINDLLEITFLNNMLLNLPLWKKHLWIELLMQNANGLWPYENIIKEYSKLREDYYHLQEQYDKIKNSGILNSKLNDTIIALQNENIILKRDNETLKREIIEKQNIYEKTKEENVNLFDRILKTKELEAHYQNKILELELHIQKYK
jgi:hypothetical protein